MGPDAKTIIVPLKTLSGNTLFIEVENVYGSGRDVLPTTTAAAVGQIANEIGGLFATALENR